MADNPISYRNAIQHRIRNIARHYYPAEGSHGWADHIADVYQTAKRLKGRPLSNVEYAAVLLHDAARRNVDIDHNVLGADKAYRTLKRHAVLPRSDIQKVRQAILEHSASWRRRSGITAPSSSAAALLALADKGTVHADLEHLVDRPMRFIFEGSDDKRFADLNKPLPYNKNNDADIAKRVHFQLKHWFGEPYKGPDTAWSRAFSKELADRYKLMQTVQPEDIQPYIAKYRKLYNTPIDPAADMSESENPTYMAVKR